MRVSIHITTHGCSIHLQHVASPQMWISQFLNLKVTFNISFSSNFRWTGMLISLISHAEFDSLSLQSRFYPGSYEATHEGRQQLIYSFAYLYSSQMGTHKTLWDCGMCVLWGLHSCVDSAVSTVLLLTQQNKWMNSFYPFKKRLRKYMDAFKKYFSNVWHVSCTSKTQ